MDREHIQKIEEICRAFLKGDLTVRSFADDFHFYFIDEVPFQRRNLVYDLMGRFHHDHHLLEADQCGWRGKVYARENHELRALTGAFLEDLRRLTASGPDGEEGQRPPPQHIVIASMVERGHIRKVEGVCQSFLQNELTVDEFTHSFHGCLMDHGLHEQYNDVHDRMEQFLYYCHDLQLTQRGWSGSAYARDNRRMRSLTRDFLEDLRQLSALERDGEDLQQAPPVPTTVALLVESGFIHKVEDVCRSFLNDALTVEEFLRRFYGCYAEHDPQEECKDVHGRMKRFLKECTSLRVTQFGWSGFAYASDNRRMRSLTRSFLEDLQRIVQDEAAQ